MSLQTLDNKFYLLTQSIKMWLEINKKVKSSEKKVFDI